MRRFLLLWLAILPATIAIGQPRLAVRTVSVAEGLSQSSAQVLFQDRLGIVWIGTQDGLNRYDGSEIVSYVPNPLDPTALSGGSVIALAEDASGVLWVGTELSGLSRFDRERGAFDVFEHHEADTSSLSSNDVSAIELASDGTLWVGTAGGGLNRFDPTSGTFSALREDPEDAGALPSDWIVDLHAQPDGDLLVATDGGGLSRLDPVSGRFDSLWPQASDTTSFPVVIAVDTDTEGGIWLATPEGLVHLDPRAEDERRIPGTEDELVFSVKVHSDGSVWAGMADGGLFVVDPEHESAVRIDETISLGDDTVYSLLEDASGIVWVGTESAGTKILTPLLDRFEQLGDSRSDPETWSILETRAGELWVASAEGGVDVLSLDGSPLRQYRAPEAGPIPDGTIPYGIALSLIEDAAGDVWLGMDGAGVARWVAAEDRFVWHRPDGQAGFRATAVMDFLVDEVGDLWMATAGWGLVLHRAGSDTFEEIPITPDSTDAANVVLSVEADPDGIFWLGTEDGIARFDPTTRDSYVIRPDPASETGLSSGTVFQVTTAGGPGLWAATPVGLNRLDQRPLAGETPVFDRLSSATGLPNDVVYAAQPDAHGTIWISTNRGLAALDPASGDVRVFGMTDGLPGFEFNHGAYTTGPSGSLYFGGIEGVSRIALDSGTFRQFEPSLVVTSVSIFNQVLATDLEDGAELRLRHDENYLTFSFASLDYLRPDQNRYAFRLEPDESEWTQAGTRRYVQYNKLAPGDYIFRVRGTNGDGVWSSASTAVLVRIIPPLWQRSWFQGLLLVGVVLGILATLRGLHRRTIRDRDARIAVQREINERLEAERLHLARELHDGPIQHLQLSGFQLRALDASVRETAGAKSLEGVRSAVGDAMQELRDICGELRPPALVHFGLSSAVRSHAERLLETYSDLTLKLTLPTGGPLLAAGHRLGLFRMYQEAMNNVVRHARPCHVGVSLTVGDDWTELVVQDDGPGFTVPSAWVSMAEARHFGLLGADERAVALGGTMTVESSPGAGTQITFRVPTVMESPTA